MRYVMRQKLLSWGNDFTIKDDTGRDAFYVDGKAFALRDKLSFQDMNGRELAFIQQKLLAWGPTYEIHRDGQLAAVVKEALFTLMGHRFSVDVPGPDDLEAQGNFTDHEYAFTRSGEVAARVSKRWFTLADTYGVDVNAGQDEVLILASTVVIERCSEKQGRKQ